MSYGINCTWNLLRHVYMSSSGVSLNKAAPLVKIHGVSLNKAAPLVKIHADMSNYEKSETSSQPDLDLAQRKNDSFFSPFNNCDTIVPFVLQTPLIWLGVLGSIIGIALSTQTFNASSPCSYRLALPIAFLFTAVYNRASSDDHERRLCKLYSCEHIPDDLE
ncbi:hypothetical protein EAI_05236 [Harpegnathos saltator]|uniref:Uncharacterized protein n=1 Tax=Harpegnathos saltator TaxID=610380 RepID=E2C9S1_HARSA|nr:hypothetical protein EAI_05236 [Harpegnathos saltator]